MIRDAVLEDVPALCGIEDRCFETDNLSARSFRRFIARSRASLRVDEGDGGRLRGYSLVLFHGGTSLARLYSFAVDPDFRGHGLARALLATAEEDARANGAAAMRLEVRRDNTQAIGLYEKNGYRPFTVTPHYYDDGMDAIRMEKVLVPHLPIGAGRAPYYAQTLDFTCGPAALMMGMKALRPALELDRVMETRIWRESTTIFMTSGPGGCGPLGLALAAKRRGFDAEVHVSDPVGIFTDSVRSEAKRDVIRLVQEDFLDTLTAMGAEISLEWPGVDRIASEMETGAVPIVLISSYRLMGDKAPHWVTITDIAGNLVYLHDPFVEFDEGRTVIDCFGIPVARAEFERMSRYGRDKHFAVLFLREP